MTAYEALVSDFAEQVRSRLDGVAELAQSGGLDAAIELMTSAIRAGGVLHAFGTGHSEAFAMEIAGRAGGLIPTNRIALRELVRRGERNDDELGGSALERDPDVAERLWQLTPAQPGDVFLIASNSGVNGSIVGYAAEVKAHGHPLIAVTSLQHTMQVEPKHPSGKRLADLADVVIDNLAPYGDATLDLEHDDGTRVGHAEGVRVGAVSSITSAYIAQLLTIGVAERIAALGETPPLYLSANIPGGDAHNHQLEARYVGRIRRGV